MTKAPTSPQDKSPFAEKLPAFIDALEVLYIRNNLSGRHKFREQWPHAANYVFGEILTQSDFEGGLDRDTRAEEEDLADDRRIALVTKIEEIKIKSVESGMLQLRYIESIIHELGRDIADDIFSDWVIEKIFPPTPPQEEIKPSPQDISGNFNTPKEIATPAAAPAPFRPDFRAPKKIFEHKRKKVPSYRELAAWAEKIFSKSITDAFNRKAA